MSPADPGRRSYGVLPSVTFRPLALEDLPTVLDIERQCHLSPWTEGIFTGCFRDDYHLLALELEHIGVVGYSVMALMYDEAHLLNLCVMPGWQGRGLARQLLRAALGQVVRAGMVRVILEVRVSNQVAQQLYQTEGFVLIGERPDYYPASSTTPCGREKALVMALELPAIT